MTDTQEFELQPQDDSSPSLLLQCVDKIAIKPEDAQKIVKQYKDIVLKRNPSLCETEVQKLVATKIVNRYAKFSGLSGGVTSLSSLLPGIGTAISMSGGVLADLSYSMKNQVDMCMCLAENFGWDICNEDAKHLTYLIASFGALEKGGSEVAVRIGSKAGVKMVKMYLKGAALTTIKELFKKIGITFTRKALEKSIPFGVGIVVSTSANYVLTKYVGKVATEWFTIEKEERELPQNEPGE